MKITPTGNRILVKPDKVETKTKSGIILTIDEKREGAASVTGTVVAIGPLAWKEFVDGTFKKVYDEYAQIGDRVQYRRYTGIVVEGDDPADYFLLMNDNDVLAVVDKETSHV